MSQATDNLGETISDSSRDTTRPSPALLILLILPLFGIFVALLMLALETRQPARNRAQHSRRRLRAAWSISRRPTLSYRCWMESHWSRRRIMPGVRYF